MEFLKIANRKNFLLKEIPTINPASRRYIKFYSEQKKRCIDGFWSIDDENINVDILSEEPEFPTKSNNWRYMSPVCYFYVNFGTILANRRGATSGAKIPMRPSLDDVEWEFNYNWIEARGFSGFEFDNEFSCNRKLIEDYSDEELKNMCLDKDGEIIPMLYNNYFKKNGSRKEYVAVREYIRRLFPKNMGRPVYGNIPSNLMILATRDGGKSWLASSVIAHEILFDGLRMYEKNGIIPVAEVVVGAALSDKSRDLLKKTAFIIDNLPGKYNKGSKNEVPSPFYKAMTGSIGANKEYVHLYKKKVGGEMKDVGSGAIIKHRVFTTENPEAAAGGRPGTIIVEEVGLLANVISVHGGNVAAQNDSGYKFGSSLYIGTAGNVDKIQESEVIFNAPEAFDMLSFDNIWEPETNDKICWFIPAPYMARSFKDKNGNTIIKDAYAFFEKRRIKFSNSPSRRAFEMEKMNYPLVPSEMFVNANANIFPVSDLKHVYSRLMTNKKELDLSYKVEFIIKEDGKIDFKNVKKRPIREYPLIGKKDESLDISGCPEIFIMPQRSDDATIPSNVYIASLDPIDDDDNSDITRSLQSFWIMNRLTGELVMEYTGRTPLASEFYEQCRRALIYYNARCNYENNKKGFYAHMYNKASLHLLVETPEILMQKDMQKSRGAGNKALGTNVNTDVKSFGLELILQWLTDKNYNNPDIMNLHTIKSPALLKELISFKPDGNFDRISALIMLLILREDKRRIAVVNKKRSKTMLDDDFFKNTWRNNQSVY
jgi:hypothetical protein